MLPRFCNPDLLASREGRLSGALPAGWLDRLPQAVDRAAGPVRVNLDFRRDAMGRTCIGGRLEVPVRLTCQRCLESFEVNLDATLDVLVVRSEEEAEAGRRGGEAVHIEGDYLSLVDLIEDELILALPMHASHPPGQCTAPAIPESCDADLDAAPPGPLAALAELIHPKPT